MEIRGSTHVEIHGGEMTAAAVRDWFGKVGVKTLYIEPANPLENGYCESFRGCTTVEIHEVRPHRSLGYRPLPPVTAEPMLALAAVLT